MWWCWDWVYYKPDSVRERLQSTDVHTVFRDQSHDLETWLLVMYGVRGGIGSRNGLGISFHRRESRDGGQDLEPGQ